MSTETSILDDWDITESYLTQVVRENPSLRGMILGYVAEKKLKDFFVTCGVTEDHRKDDDHDREKKGDLTLKYKGEEIIIEVKSLQTNSIKVKSEEDAWVPMIEKVPNGRKPSKGLKKNGEPRLGDIIYKYQKNKAYDAINEAASDDLEYQGSFQCDASDCRPITLDNGEVVLTTLLKVGEFDVIAAGLFSFRNKWEFGFALNEDLPRSEQFGENSSHLISSLVDISLPLKPPFKSNPFEVFDDLIERRRKK